MKDKHRQTRYPIRPTERSTSILYIRGVPFEVKAHFKAYCAKRGKSMTDVIVELMRRQIEKASA